LLIGKKIGWYMSDDLTRPSARIRGWNIMNFLQKKYPQVLFSYFNPKIEYDIVIFIKKPNITLANELKHSGTRIIYDVCDLMFKNMALACEMSKIADFVISDN